MPATVEQTMTRTEFAAKKCAKLVTWMSERADSNAFYITDGPNRKTHPTAPLTVPLESLPKELATLDILASAWAEGLVELGRAAHSWGFYADHKGAARVDENGVKLTFAWIDEGMNWSKQRNTYHKPIKDILDEDKTELPEKVTKQIKLWSKEAKEYEIRKVEFPGALLRLQVRLTDKGHSTLGGF